MANPKKLQQEKNKKLKQASIPVKQLTPVAPQNFGKQGYVSEQAFKATQPTISAPKVSPIPQAPNKKFEKKKADTFQVERGADQYGFKQIIADQFKEISGAAKNFGKSIVADAPKLGLGAAIAPTLPALAGVAGVGYLGKKVVDSGLGQELAETALAPLNVGLGAVSGAAGSDGLKKAPILNPDFSINPQVVEDFKRGAKASLMESFGQTEGKSQQLLGGKLIRSNFSTPDYSGGAKQDVAAFVKDLPKLAAIAAINIVADPLNVIPTSLGASKGAQFVPEVEAALKKAGVLDFASDVVEKVSRAGTKDTEEFANALYRVFSGTKDGEKVLEVLGKSEAPDVAKATINMVDLQKQSISRKAEQMSKDIFDSVDQRISNDKKVVGQKTALYRVLKAQESAAKAGFKAGAKDAIERGAVSRAAFTDFAKQALDLNILSQADELRVRDMIANISTEKNLGKALDDVAALAERSVKKDLMETIASTAARELENFADITAGRVQAFLEESTTLNPSKSLGAIYTQEERDFLGAISQFSQGPKIANKEGQRFASALDMAFEPMKQFIIKNPEFSDLPKSFIEKVKTHKFALSDLSAEELGSLYDGIATLMERGSLRAWEKLVGIAETSQMAVLKIVSQEAPAYKGLSDEVFGEGDNIGLLGSPYSVRLDSLRASIVADRMDGMIGNVTQMKERGQFYKEVYNPMLVAQAQFDKNMNDFKGLVLKKFINLGLGDNDLRLLDAALTFKNEEVANSWVKAGASRQAINKILEEADANVNVARGIKIISEELKSLYPKMNAVSIETSGKPIGFTENYWMIDDKPDGLAGDLSVFNSSRNAFKSKSTTKFANISKQRTNKLSKKKALVASGATDRDAILTIFKGDVAERFTSYVRKANRFITIQPALKRAELIVKDPQFKSWAGSELAYYWQSRVEDFAYGSSKAFREGGSQLKILSLVAMKSAIAYLSSPIMAVKQMSSIINALKYVPPEYIIRAIGKMAPTPVELLSMAYGKALSKETASRVGTFTEFAYKNSSYLASQSADSSLYDIAKLMTPSKEGTRVQKALGATAKAISDVGQAALDITVSKADYIVKLWSWHAAYEHGVDLGLKGQEAFRYADDVVADTQGMGNYLDKPTFFANNAVTSTIFPFQTFATVMENSFRDQVAAISFGKKAIVNKDALTVLAIAIGSVWMDQSFNYLGRSRERDNEKYTEKIAQNVSYGMLGQIAPQAPLLASIVRGSEYGKGLSVIPLERANTALTSIRTLLLDDYTDKKAIKNLVGVAGYALGAPVRFVDQTYTIGSRSLDFFLDSRNATLPGYKSPYGPASSYSAPPSYGPASSYGPPPSYNR